MDKNTVIGFILMAAVFVAFGWYNTPSEEQLAEQARQDSIAVVQQQKKEQAEQKAAVQKQQKIVEAQADTNALFHAALNGTKEDVVLENEKVALTLSSKGGVVTKAVIKGYNDQEGNPDITLFDAAEQKLNFIFAAKDININTADLYFTATEKTANAVTFVAEAAEGKSLEIKYELGKDYLLHCWIKANNMAGMFAPNTSKMDINWQEQCRQQERGHYFENRYATLTYHFTDGGTDYLSETSKKVDEVIDETTDWVSFKTQFFSAIMITKNEFDADAMFTSVPVEKGTGYLKNFEAKLKTFFDPTGTTPTEFEFYYGPNDFRTLQSMNKESSLGKDDLQMERLVYLGWPLIRYINRWFTLYVFDWLAKMSIPMGIVLILITLLLKVITFPMVKKSYMSSAKMRVLKPKLDEATKQYDKPEDQMQKQQAMMQMYSEYGVSPMAGCVPMLIQMPIWIAMFNFVPNAIQLRGESFLWIDDLSTYDPIIEWGTNLWLIGDHLSLTCILFCGANVIYSWLTMRQQRDQMVGQQAQQMKMMQWMMFLMPVMFFFMFNDYSAGLNFYYFVSLFCSALIMWVLRKTTNDAKLLAALEQKRQENKANPNRKMSGLAARMQAMQKEAEELRKKREELERKNRALRGDK